MNDLGYYRYPTVHNGTVIFVSEGDLWTVSLKGGVPRRLTAGKGTISHPKFSPDGKRIAFSGTEEGHCEVYVLPSQGGATKRITFLGDNAQVVDWTEKGIIFASASGHPWERVNRLFSVDPDTGDITQVPVGFANHISYGDGGKSVIQRHGSREFGFWKRYRGGTAGELWIDNQGDGNFKKLIDTKGNVSRAFWVGKRIFFASDHEGTGNIYSCDVNGKTLKRHTHHEDFYARNPSCDGSHVVYHAGGDMYAYDLATSKSNQVKIDYSSSREHRNRKFVPAAKYLEDFAVHPEGHHLASVSRGKAFCYGNWEGPALQFGEEPEARYRLARWFNDGKRLLIVSDEDGEETIAFYAVEGAKNLKTFPKSDIGRVLDLKVSPTKDEAAFTNHRSELIHINLKNGKIKKLDRSEFGAIAGFDWSPDGNWLAYSCSTTRHTSVIKMVSPTKGKPEVVTKAVLRDVSPAFDPDGKYLYFLSYRQFDPTWDTLHFEMGFPKGMRPYLITLQKDLPFPFKDLPSDLELTAAKKLKKPSAKKAIKIDFAGIKDRICAFPVGDGVYCQIAGIKDKVLFSSLPIEGALEDHEGDKAKLEVYDFETQKAETLVSGLSEFHLSKDLKWMIYRADNQLRVVRAGEKPSDQQSFTKKDGWIDLSRLNISIDPVYEWRQMLREAWRLQRDHFWTEDMSKIDWEQVYKKYAPLVERVNTREEFSDLLWEMQGELGTSHAYVWGGDIPSSPHYGVGLLAADFAYDAKRKAYKITNIAEGDPWDTNNSSPLVQTGVQVNEGDLLWAVSSHALSESVHPAELLINSAGKEVQLTVSDGKGKNKRNVTVQTLKSQTQARYREWVEKNREYVHKKTNNKVGYLHIPNMQVWGFSEFHRGFLAECDKDGLVVDARFNGGGSISPLLLEKLARRRLGFDLTRWFGAFTYPEDSPAGPMVALTNEYAGSDGDIFTHGFKMLKLGPVIGKRTWGGVIGIWPRHPLVDGGITTQPEFSFWFKDIGWSVENYGVDPDIEVEITPQDYVQGKDPQLDRGIAEVLAIIKKNPPIKGPDLTTKPSLKMPQLPK